MYKETENLLNTLKKTLTKLSLKLELLYLSSSRIVTLAALQLLSFSLELIGVTITNGLASTSIYTIP